MKRIAKWISIITLFIVALYFAGVYSTGYALRYGLKNIDQYVKLGVNAESKAKYVDDIFELSYTSEKTSLFTENGFISFKLGESVKKAPIDISIGFLGTDFITDTSALNSTFFKLIGDVLEAYLGDSIDKCVKLSASKSSVKGSASIFKGAFLDVSFNAPYKSNKKKLTFDASVRASLNKNINVNIISRDLVFDNLVAKKIDAKLDFSGFDRLERFDSLKISADNLHFQRNDLSDLYVTLTGFNSTDDSFDVKIDLSIKRIVDILSDLKANMLGKGLSYTQINSALKDGDFDDIFNSLKRLDVAKLEAVLDSSFKTYIGVDSKKLIKFTADGYILFDPNENLSMQEMSLDLKTKDAKGAEFLFRKNNGEYVCKLEYKKDRLYINGMRF